MRLTRGYEPGERTASGLRPVKALRDPEREATARLVVETTTGSAVLRGLVALAASVAQSTYVQVSLLAEQQVIAAVNEPVGAPDKSTRLEDSFCTVTVLSGDVLVAADSRSHPWLQDLPAVASGRVAAYLGVPLAMPDGTMVGALCVYDSAPRAWSHRDVALVCEVADVVAAELHHSIECAQAARPSQPAEGAAGQTS